MLNRYATYLINTAMLLLVLAGAGNIHSHLCLDGQEPPLTVHFENFSGHPQHDLVGVEPDAAHEHEHGDDHAHESVIEQSSHEHGEAMHVDVETELLTEGPPGKAPDHGSVLFLAATALLICLRRPERQFHAAPLEVVSYHPPTELIPAPRAPPVHSS